MGAQPDLEQSAAPDDWEALAREADEAERWHEATRAEHVARLEWPALRLAVLERGGIGPSPDWPRDWYPADLYRADGLAPDLMAAECAIGRADLPPWGDGGDDGAMFAYLQAAYADWHEASPAERRSQSIARPRAAVRIAGNVARDLPEPEPVTVGLSPAELAREWERFRSPILAAAVRPEIAPLPATWEPNAYRPSPTAPVAAPAPIPALALAPVRRAVLAPALASLRARWRRSPRPALRLVAAPAPMLRIDPRARERRARAAFLAGLFCAHALAGALIGLTVAVVVGGWTPPAALAPLATMPAALVPVAYVSREAIKRARRLPRPALEWRRAA